ncbi:MAG: hypothetical protein ACK4GJ_06065 [bacterium]
MNFLKVFLLLISFALAFSFANDKKYFIIDSSLYRIENEKKFLILDNVEDLFYYQGTPFFVQLNENQISIFQLKKTKLIPFLQNRESVRKIADIKTSEKYLGNFQFKNQIFILTNKSVYLLEKNYFPTLLEKWENFECVNIFQNTFALKNIKNNLYYVYENKYPLNYLFNSNFDILLQVSKINQSYLVLGLNQLYGNQYNLNLKYINPKNNITLFSKPVSVFYDSIFYFIPINEKYVLLQEKDKVGLYQMVNDSFLKEISEIPSFYSYFTNNYLFVINNENLNIFLWQDYDFYPLFSIPKVNFIFFLSDTLYYLFYDLHEEVWKMGNLKIEQNSPIQYYQEIVFFKLPEEVIPIQF